MKNELEQLVFIRDGIIPVWLQEIISSFVKSLDGKYVSIHIREKRKQRSGQQNRFYWGCVTPIVVNMFLEAGDTVTKDEVHEYLMREVGKYVEVSKLTGVEIRRSSTKLTTVEWEEYLEKIRVWAAEFGVPIPFPNEEGI